MKAKYFHEYNFEDSHNILYCKPTRFKLRSAKAFAALITLTLIFSGCAKQRWDPDTDPSAVACQNSYDFTPGTPEYDQCMQRFKEIESRKTTWPAY
jgi:hypothetical protein